MRRCNQNSYAKKMLAEVETGMRNPLVPGRNDGRYRCPFDWKILGKDVHSVAQHAFGLGIVGSRNVDAKGRAEHKALYEFLEGKDLVPKKPARAGPSKKKAKFFKGHN